MHFAEKECILTENHPGQYFYIIKSGKASAHRNNKKIRTITKYDYFGERALLFNNKRSATIRADEKMSCWIIEKNDFMNIITPDIRSQLINRIELQDDTIKLDDLVYIKQLGFGMFGNVYLMIHSKRNKLYALKTLLREKIDKLGIHENVQMEREIALEVQH